MPLDPNIILQGRGIQLDSPMDLQNKALTMKQLSQTTQRNDQAMADDALAKQTKMAKELAWSVPTDPKVPIADKQAAWTQMKAQAAKFGLPNNDKLPDQYPGDSFAQNMQFKLLSADEQRDEHWKQKQMENDQLNRQDAREERRALHGFARTDREEARTDKQVEGLQSKLAPMQDIHNALSRVEQKVGFKLGDYDPATNKAKRKNPQTGMLEEVDVDLPGMSLPGIGRVTAYSNDARTLENAMTKVFNVELKDRSGAAVTSNELDRLREEFSSGKFNTEGEKLAALRDYQIAAQRAMQNAEAGFNPKAVATYSQRGGMTSARTSAAGEGQRQAGYDNMSDEQLAALYQQRMKGAKNANSR